MADLTSDRLARLRRNAEAVKAAGHSHVNADPDDVLGLLDEIERLRAVIQDVRDEGEPINNTWGACSWCAAHLEGGADHKPDCAWLKVAEVTDPLARPPLTDHDHERLAAPDAPRLAVDAADVLPFAPDPATFVDLMAALEKSIAAAKAARKREGT